MLGMEYTCILLDQTINQTDVGFNVNIFNTRLRPQYVSYA